MNKLVYSAVALTLVSAPGVASENEWSSLDQEIASLTSSLNTQNTGPKVGGWIQTSWRFSDDIDVDPSTPSSDDENGFQLDQARVEITGDAGSGYSYKLSFDFGGSGTDGTDSNGDSFTIENVGTLKDAYATWKIGDMVTGKMGRFKQPFLRSALVSDNKLLFLDRSFLGEQFSGRDLGIMFSGQFDTIDWHAAAQNGSDGQAEDYLFTGRVTANLMGAGVGKVEGAYGAGEETNLTAGVAISDDGAVDNGMALALEVAMTAGPFAVAAEVVDLDDDIGDATPWDVTGSYMFTDMYELAARYEDGDDTNDTTRWLVGVNRYTQGHDIKWMAQFASSDSDVATAEVDEFALGLVLSF
jgi:phosphate-selective porin